MELSGSRSDLLRGFSQDVFGSQPSEYLTGARGSTSNRLIHTAVALSHHVLLSSQHASRSPLEQVTQERHSVFYDIDMEVAWYHVWTVVG